MVDDSLITAIRKYGLVPLNGQSQDELEAMLLDCQWLLRRAMKEIKQINQSIRANQLRWEIPTELLPATIELRKELADAQGGKPEKIKQRRDIYFDAIDLTKDKDGTIYATRAARLLGVDRTTIQAYVREHYKHRSHDHDR